jgi:hypothetical protein
MTIEAMVLEGFKKIDRVQERQTEFNDVVIEELNKLSKRVARLEKLSK